GTGFGACRAGGMGGRHPRRLTRRGALCARRALAHRHRRAPFGHWGACVGSLAIADPAGYPSREPVGGGPIPSDRILMGCAVATYGFGRATLFCGSAASMAVKRINRAIELLEQDQAIYYTRPPTPHLPTPLHAKPAP